MWPNTQPRVPLASAVPPSNNPLQLELWDAMAGGPPPAPPRNAFLFPFGYGVEHIRNEMAVGLKQMLNLAKATQWVFFERPGWTIGQIAERYEPMMPKHELHRIAYLCTSGAWKGVLFRFGFDPRLDADARYLQTMYWHLPHDSRVDSLRKHTFATVWANMQRLAQERQTTTFEVRKTTEPPLKFQGIELADDNAWMLADIRAKEVRQVLDDARYVAAYTPRHGHLHAAVIPYFATVLKRKAVEFSKLRGASTVFSKGFAMGEEDVLPFMAYVKDNHQRLRQWTEPQRVPPSSPPRVGVAWDDDVDEAVLMAKLDEEGPKAATNLQAAEREVPLCCASEVRCEADATRRRKGNGARTLPRRALARRIWKSACGRSTPLRCSMKTTTTTPDDDFQRGNVATWQRGKVATWQNKHMMIRLLRVRCPRRRRRRRVALGARRG